MPAQLGSFFPEGVFDHDANHEFDLWIRRARGQVIFDFHTKVSYVGMSSFQARQIAHALVSYAEILEREAGVAPGFASPQLPGAMPVQENDHLGGVREEKPAELKTPATTLEGEPERQ